MAKNYFNRYVWLIDTIYRRGHISLQDISRNWERSSINDDGRPMAERTFHNHREAILDMFGIEIKNDRSLGYYIDSEDMEGDAIKKWLLEFLSMNNLVNEAGGLRDRILFEKIPSSQKWLPVIVNAMRDGMAVEFTYQSFWRDDPATFIAHPYCLKLFKQCWYVLARSEDYKEPWIYALDERMQNVVPVKKKLTVPVSFDAASYFADYFGIIVDNNIKPTEIKISVVKHQERFFETLPLHESQRRVDEESTNTRTVFRYFLAPTYDFKQEVRGTGLTLQSCPRNGLEMRLLQMSQLWPSSTAYD